MVLLHPRIVRPRGRSILILYELFKFWGFRDDGLRGAGFRLHDYISSDMEFVVEGSCAVARGEAQ